MHTPQYITDNKGKKLSVVLPIKDYRKIMEELEELEDIRLYDEAMASKERSMPIEKAFKLIEAKRKKK
ncbi:MAG: hypothetical protein J7502_15860 [Flavisolibacter sp.]|nr:hypothetical protein [Flavisolibacter sp.]